MDQIEPAGGSRMARKKEETRRKIVDVALGLFEQHGFEATTMEHIAEVADIAKGTLYNYFPAKESIVNEYVRRSFRERNAGRFERLGELPDTRSRLVMVLGELMDGVQAQRELFEKFLAGRVQSVVSLRPDHSEGSKSGLDALAAAIIRLGQDAGEIRADLPPGMLVDLFEFVFVEAAKQLYVEPETFDARRAVEQAADLFMGGAGR